MNTYQKFCPNVFLAKCSEKHEKGEVIEVTTKYGKENECIVHNLIYERDGYYFYSITRADGYNAQERAKAKAEKYHGYAATALKRSHEFHEKSNKDRDFLSLGEPIKVGHHSESRHRKAIKDAWNNIGKAVAMEDKAIMHENKASYWEGKTDEINLSMPESIEYYEQKLAKATEYHQGLKTGKYPKEHSYSMAYAKKAVNEAQKNYELAKRLWG